jgi:hypothetical protein
VHDLLERPSEGVHPPTLAPGRGAPDPADGPSGGAALPGILLVAATALALVAIGAAAWSQTGIAPFTLDDPLIHVRVAQQLSGGHYGLNPGETASPSSSAIWPFLLAPFGGTSAVLWVPFALTGTATLLAVHLLHATLRRSWATVDPRGWITAALAGALALIGGVLALAFMGLEHSLQVAAYLAILLALAKVAEGQVPPTWSLVVMATFPLVRYEGLMVAIAAVGALVVLGHRRRAAVALGGAVASTVAFSAFLVAIGRSPIPSSVLAKAATVGGGTSASGVIGQALENWERAYTFSFPTLVALVLVATVLAVVEVIRRSDATADLRRELTLLAVSATVLAGHLSLFGHDAYWRYEAYALLGAVVAIVGALPAIARASLAPGSSERSAVRSVLAAGALAVVAVGFGPGASGVVTIALAAALVALPLVGLALRQPRRSVLVLAALAMALAATAPLLIRTAAIGSDARAIALQQHQSHRLVQLLDEPIAANDIGWVSVDARHDVLDLWGLASEDAREARAEGAPGWMDDLLADEGVDIALVYDTWFVDQIPDSWVVAGRMVSEEQGMTSHREVTVYGRDDAAADRARAALEALEPTLPDGASIELG